MIESSGKPHTAHTCNPVPLTLVSGKKYRLHTGILADVAPTILDLLNIEKPDEMTGKSLLVR
ncbi:MAG: 2,3-bisphosphoglycerate-independent phosphoglycerate mutase [Candidatus Argoarchaeum ethanivorans]|nr:MAG: 2,3-bisphosphoglycerate-independent phosphoglycerate mutase [Candidatus Argoarchaeum ethanivorans]